MYYIYIYLDPLTPGNYSYQELTFCYEPFYVGRGKNYRYKVHCQNYKLKTKNDKNLKINNILSNNLKPIIYLYKTGITFTDSLNEERILIEKIGRKKLKNGPLTNLTSGGQGVLGLKMSNNTKRKIKKTCLERGVYDKLREDMKGSKNPMSGDKWHRTEQGKLNFKNKMKNFSPLKNKTQSEKDAIHSKISKTLKGYEWSETEKIKRKKGMEKVWRTRKENNILIKKNTVNVKITDILTKEERIFETKKEAAVYLNLNPVTIWRRYKENKIVDNKKIEFIR